MAIPDVHFPYADIKAINEVFEYMEDHQPDIVVQMGDVLDMYNFSTHPKSATGYSPIEELTEGRAQLEAFWATVDEVAPGAEKHQLMGNHDARLWKTLVKKAPEYEAILDILDAESLFRVDGVTLHSDWRKPVHITDKLVFHHGWTQFGRHYKHFLKSTIVGHTHKGGIEFLKLWDETIYEMQCGFLGDRDALAFKYPPTSTTNWQTGFGVIDEYGPRFIAL